MGSQLNTVKGSYDGAMKKLTGQGNLITRVEKLKKLGEGNALDRLAYHKKIRNILGATVLVVLAIAIILILWKSK